MGPDDLTDLSPALRRLYDAERAAGNVVVRIDRDLWTACPLAVIFRDPLHFDAAPATADGVERWENRDPHYSLEAGWQCRRTRHVLAGPLENPAA